MDFIINILVLCAGVFFGFCLSSLLSTNKHKGE